MKISTNNVLDGVAPSITAGSLTDEVEANIVDPDFSTFYTSGSNSTFTMSFGSVSSIDYVAIAGINIKGLADDTSYITVNDSTTEVARIYVNTDQVVVIEFTAQTFSDLVVTLVNGAADKAIVVKYVAAGTMLTVPNSGEQAGYNRQYLERNYKNKTTFNSLTEPVSVLRKRIQAKGKLSIPNASRSFCETTWQTFLDFSINNLFFIIERDAELVATKYYAPAAYLCYELDSNTMKAHSSTRSLNNISIGFKVYNGL